VLETHAHQPWRIEIRIAMPDQAVLGVFNVLILDVVDIRFQLPSASIKIGQSKVRLRVPVEGISRLIPFAKI
jgi:hypothetical protein